MGQKKPTANVRINRAKQRRGGKTSFRRQLIRTLPLLLGAVALTLFFSRAGYLRELETNTLDTLMRLKSAPAGNSDIVIVHITDQNYQTIFNGKSPLDPQRLRALIDAIARGRPKLIGVDIDTSDPVFKDMRLPTDGPPIVWARNAIFSHRKNGQHPGRVLGGAELSPPPPSGVIVLKQDDDHALRRYQRLYYTEDGTLLTSFSWTVINACNAQLAQRLGASAQELLINYAGDPQHSGRTYIEAGNILKFAEAPEWPTSELIKDKIVLLGGDYAVQDEHDTPVGWMLGVEVQAQVIETELHGGGWRPASRLVIAVLEILDGLVLLLLFHFFRLGKAIVIAMVATPILALTCSFLSFGSFGLWAYYVPILLAVLIHQLYDQGKEYLKHLRERLEGKEQD